MQMIMEYAEVEEEGGIIAVALDHIGGVLSKPISLACQLHHHRDTPLRKHGNISDDQQRNKLKVIREVCQGDSLSCLLFDVAVTPLTT
jgi:hypothetical protein